jgi:hypothetical protein
MTHPHSPQARLITIDSLSNKQIAVMPGGDGQRYKIMFSFIFRDDAENEPFAGLEGRRPASPRRDREPIRAADSRGRYGRPAPSE